MIPFCMILDLLVFIACAGLPWLIPAQWSVAAALGGIIAWFALVRPTWSRLLPFYLTVGLVVNLAVRLGVLLIR